MFTKMLGYKIFNESKSKLIEFIKDCSKINIISGNPEILYRGIKDKKLYEIYNQDNALVIPDGIGTVIASKLINNPVKERIAGIEVMEDIIKLCAKEGKGVYLVGSKEEVLEGCISNLIRKYPNLKIKGSHHGYFDIDNCDYLIEDIKNKKPYAIFVAMGCPKQELFIYNYYDILPCSIFMGVGGSFDVFAGKTNRAPRWMINLGLEWLYRVIKEPFRIKRLLYIPKFLFNVIVKKGS